ncbi:MAG: hypothetical protein HKP30_01800 [Myxococcales bacterium]|nr:hypothetical protein [Myxococcales bacterium]
MQRVADVAPGTTVIQGQLADFEEDLPVVLTQSGNYTFVNVSTQNGVYTGEFADGSGWLHFDDLEDRLVDHSNPDVLVPGDEETS